MITQPEILVTPDFPTIKFREPRDLVNLDIELPKILHNQGWGCGTYFHVQFMNHERNELLTSSLFVVTKETEALQTTDNPYQPMTKTIYTREVKQIGDWWVNSLPETEKKGPAQMIATRPKVTWNPGKKMHQVKLDDKVVYETPDKELAHQIADGKTPIPKAA